DSYLTRESCKFAGRFVVAYNETTGEFATLAGQITVPAATYTQDETGAWVITPGVSVLRVVGTV
ncbi:MAG: hypothetical protein E7478_06815, partial [Ruminococcaceae bacterium]|nr:hypothetical protein [Oscillospiraceae bacterium]